MLSTKNVEVKDTNKVSSYVNVGINKIKINNVDTKESSKGSYQVVFHVEGEPVSDPNFKGVDGAYGPVGRVTTSYLGNDSQVKDFIDTVALLSTKLGVKEQVDAISASDVKSYVEQISPILSGKYFHARVTGEEYAKATGGVGVNLHFSKFGAFASESEGSEKLKPFDKTNKYDYKKVEAAPQGGSTVSELSY